MPMKLDAKAYFEPDALTDINAHDFAQALAGFGLEMVMKGDGIAIRKAKTTEPRDRIDNWIHGGAGNPPKSE